MLTDNSESACMIIFQFQKHLIATFYLLFERKKHEIDRTLRGIVVTPREDFFLGKSKKKQTFKMKLLALIWI